MRYAVYRVTAQPGLGGRRVYIGALCVLVWDAGGCPQRAAEARVAEHVRRGRRSAPTAGGGAFTAEHGRIRGAQALVSGETQKPIIPWGLAVKHTQNQHYMGVRKIL